MPSSPRKSRWIRRTLARVAFLGLALVGAVLLLVHHLDHPWVKRRVQALARGQHADVDYHAVRLSLGDGGVAIDDLVVQTPADLRDVAPELLRVGHVEVTYAYSGAPVVKRVRLRDVHLTLVDRDGHTSLDAFSTPSKEPKVPLSGLLADALKGAAPVGSVDVEGLEVVLHTVRAGHREEMGLAARGTLTLSLEDDGPTFALQLHAGTAAHPLDVDVWRGNARAHTTLALAADVSRGGAVLALGVEPHEQTFIDGLTHPPPGLTARARAMFDPKMHRARAAVEAHIPGALDLEQGEVEVGDDMRVLLHGVQLEADVEKVLGLLPAGLVPVRARDAHVRCTARDVVLDPSAPHGGPLDLDVQVADLHADVAGGVDVASLRVRAHASSDDVVSGRAELSVAHATVGHTTTRNVRADLDASFAGTTWNARAALSADDVDLPGFHAGALVAKVQVKDLVVPPDAPLASHGDLLATVTAAEVVGPSLSAENVEAKLHAPWKGGVPYTVDGDVRASLHVKDLGSFPVHTSLSVTNLYPDLERPAASRAHVRAELEIASLRATATVAKAATAADFDLDASLPTLEDLQPYVQGAAAAAVPWQRISAAFHAKGRASALDTGLPRLEQDSELTLRGVSVGPYATRLITLASHTQGDAVVHDVTADLHLDGLAIDEEDAADDHVHLVAHLDRGAPKVSVDVELSGHATAKLSATAAIDRSTHAVHYTTRAEISSVGAALPFVSSFAGARRVFNHLDPTQLSLVVRSSGQLTGLVDGVDPVRWSHRPLEEVGVETAIDLIGSNVRYAQNEAAFEIPSFGWHGDVHASPTRRELDSHIDLPHLHLIAGTHKLEVSGLRDKLHVAVTGDLHDPVVEFAQKLNVSAIKHDVAPWYPIADVTIGIGVRREADMVNLTELTFDNAAAGTVAKVTGHFDLDEAHRRLTLKTELTQDLARLSRTADVFSGRGRLDLSAKVDSHDPSAVHVRADARITDAFATAGKGRFTVERANGEIPIALVLDLRRGLSVLTDAKLNPYALMRFSDQHPLVSGRSFLAIDAVGTPWARIAPLAGNLQVDQNIVSLRQFEAGVRDGRVTGDCIFEWLGDNSRATLRLRATGVKSSHGEPFDGSSAVVFNAADRSIEGRAEIVRIGERHLLDLLDLEDPTHTDVAMNRIRGALAWGYPDRVRIAFNHGFATARVELGGIASLFNIGELRGIPIGPLIDRTLTRMQVSP